jgi:hypothetical protein
VKHDLIALMRSQTFNDLVGIVALGVLLFGSLHISG